MEETTLLFELPQIRDFSGEGQAGELPDDVLLFARGVTETSKGRFIFDELAADSVMRAFMEQGIDRLAFDYGHGMVKPVSSDSHKAAGWFRPEVRADGLYACEIEWTQAAKEALGNREYRFFSPAFAYDEESRRIKRLINVALTNIPATKNQRPLVLDDSQEANKQPKENEKMQILLDSLGVSDEAGAVAKLGELKAELSESAKRAEQFEALASEANAKLATVEKERAAEKRSAAIEALCAEGKLLAAQKDFAALLSEEQFTVFVGTLSAIPALTKGRVSEPKSTETLSDEERAVFSQLGIKEEK